MTDTAQLRALLRQSGYKLEYVARVLQISPATLRHKLHGATEFKLNEAERLAALLNLTAPQRELYFFGAGWVGAPEPHAPERGDAHDAGAVPQNQDRAAAVRPARPY